MRTSLRVVRSHYHLFMLAAVAGAGVQTPTARAQEPETMDLTGALRDFRRSHEDFNVVPAGGYGHYAANLWVNLNEDGRPVFTGAGRRITSQWYDKDGRPIQPYSGPGLPFGHFDVDVYDEPSADERYHEHQFDDKFDITSIDVANNPRLLFVNIVGSGYPNNLRLEFVNAHHGGGGTYTFEAGDGEFTGNTADGFATTFTPASLQQLEVNMVSLADLRPTAPRASQQDPVDRDDAFAIRMYDVVTDEMVYEIAVYHHLQRNPVYEETEEGEDSCGVEIADTAGLFGAADTGAITSADSFSEWYRDELGTNLSKAHTIVLTRVSGVWEYLEDEFHPIDGQLFGNEGDSYNNYFTYAIKATFVYEACTDQFFEFAGDDDAWLFVNGKLRIDIGGAGSGELQYVAMDRLDLVDGETYELNFFSASRQPRPGAFRMRTSIFLSHTSSSTTAAYD